MCYNDLKYFLKKINAKNNLCYLILFSNWLIYILKETNENKLSNVANLGLNGYDTSMELRVSN